MATYAPRIVVAPDKFRGSLTAVEASEIIAAGINSVLPAAQCRLKPIADGGEGTVDAAVVAGAQRRCAIVHGPTGDLVNANWALFDDGTAVVETAQASGLGLVEPSLSTAERASSYGTGEVIAAALDAGAGTIIVGLGGSATTDGGSGALTALGLRLLDSRGRHLELGGAALCDVAAIDSANLDARLARVTLRLATDVTNPLLGPTGAASVFAPQKGATSDDSVQRLNRGLSRWAAVLAGQRLTDPDTPGFGAAGGLAFGLATLAPQATVQSGFDLVAELIDLNDALDTADAVVTGEGSMDEQSLRGKAPIGVLNRARQRGLAVYVLAGRISVRTALEDRGVAAAIALCDQAHSLQDSLDRAPDLLRAAAASAIGHLRTHQTARRRD